MSGHYQVMFVSTSQCKEICERACSKLCEIDRTVEYIRNTSTKVTNADIEEAIKDLEYSKACVLSKVKTLTDGLELQMEYSALSVKIAEANSLLNATNELCIQRMSAIRDAVHESLEKLVKESSDNVMARAKGQAAVRINLESILASIGDAEVRCMVRLLVRNPQYNDMSLEEVEKVAIKRLHKAVELSKKEEEELVAKAVVDMRASKVDEETIEVISIGSVSSPKDIMEMMREADAAIVSENVRRGAINAIIANISEKGFIVDKKNIRIMKDTNTVRMTALKPGGQKAEFTVNLDGSFIYKFDDYEGQACQKDIKPFIADLESIYGIKITYIKENWVNPDKNAKMSYQKMDVMRNN